MFIELVHALRCTGNHSESLLVATANRMVERDIVDGLLGCPVCMREYPIVNGVAHFEDAPLRLPDPVEPSTQDALRLAAFLDLGPEGGGGAGPGFALLFGAWGCHARLLQSLVDQHLIVVNAPRSVLPGEGVSLLVTGSALPLAPAIACGGALDGSCGQALADATARAVRPGGRLLGPLTLVPPAEAVEFARDGTVWVAETVSPPPTLVTLAPRRGR